MLQMKFWIHGFSYVYGRNEVLRKYVDNDHPFKHSKLNLNSYALNMFLMSALKTNKGNF